MERRFLAARVTRGLGTAALTALFLPAVPAAAQSSGDGFLFQPPRIVGHIRFGIDQPMLGSDLFTFVMDELTLDKSDFRSTTVGGDLAIPLTPRLSVVGGLRIFRSASASEFRDWVDNRELPITQTTTFLRVPVTVGLKMYLTEPGRSIGRFAWIPHRYAPYVGVAGGAVYWVFDQEGDFIDFETLNVFFDHFKSKGWRGTVQALGGLEVSVSKRFAFTTEFRYDYAQASLSTDFTGFEPIDLSGVSFSVGLAARY